MNQLILIEKYSSSSIFWPNLIKHKQLIALSVEEIINKYQGFEGELIASFQLYGNEMKLSQIIDEWLNKKKINRNLMMHFISNEEVLPSFLQKKTACVGYDIGVCEEEKTIYSSVFNEILFGNLPELISYKNILNNGLLFPTKLIAEEYISMHDLLSFEGKGVEDYEKMLIYKIWNFLA